VGHLVTLRVLLVDDDPLVRSGLRAILSADPEIEVVGEAGDGRAALAAVRDIRPDVVLMDLQMPVMGGVEATAHLAAEPQGPPVVVLTTFHLDEHVTGALRAGASGYLLKDAPPAEVARAVHAAVAGESVLSPAVARAVIDRLGDDSADLRAAAARERLAALTEREREVAVEVGAGRSNAEVGATLFMSEATVKAHVSRALTKVGAANRVQLAILVHEADLGGAPH
jgi:DNA-binding NarL/FixJ family response regulator